jgi:hypothetical protein
MRAAVEMLETTILARYFDQAREGLRRLEREPVEWREHTGTGDETVWLTAPELAALQAEQDKLLEAYRERGRDPRKRPAGARQISVIQIVFPVDGGPR